MSIQGKILFVLVQVFVLWNFSTGSLQLCQNSSLGLPNGASVAAEIGRPASALFCILDTTVFPVIYINLPSHRVGWHPDPTTSGVTVEVVHGRNHVTVNITIVTVESRDINVLFQVKVYNVAHIQSGWSNYDYILLQFVLRKGLATTTTISNQPTATTTESKTIPVITATTSQMTPSNQPVTILTTTTIKTTTPAATRTVQGTAETDPGLQSEDVVKAVYIVVPVLILLPGVGCFIWCCRRRLLVKTKAAEKKNKNKGSDQGRISGDRPKYPDELDSPYAHYEEIKDDTSNNCEGTNRGIPNIRLGLQHHKKDLRHKNIPTSGNYIDVIDETSDISERYSSLINSGLSGVHSPRKQYRNVGSHKSNREMPAQYIEIIEDPPTQYGQSGSSATKELNVEKATQRENNQPFSSLYEEINDHWQDSPKRCGPAGRGVSPAHQRIVDYENTLQEKRSENTPSQIYHTCTTDGKPSVSGSSGIFRSHGLSKNHKLVEYENTLPVL